MLPLPEMISFKAAGNECKNLHMSTLSTFGRSRIRTFTAEWSREPIQPAFTAVAPVAPTCAFSAEAK